MMESVSSCSGRHRPHHHYHHHHYHHYLLGEAEQPEGDTQLEEDAGHKEANAGRAERHVLQEDLPAEEAELPGGLDDVDQPHDDDDDLAHQPHLVAQRLVRVEVALLLRGCRL